MMAFGLTGLNPEINAAKLSSLLSPESLDQHE